MSKIKNEEKNIRQEVNVTEEQTMVLAFKKWQELLVQGEVPDCKRCHDEFFEYYGGLVNGEGAPFYLMFCAFVGAMDMIDLIEREKKVG